MANYQGLTSEAAQTRLIQDGYNELQRGEHRSLLRIIIDVMREPMFGLLFASGLIYLLLGDHIEALLLLIFACFSIGIAIIQESRSEHVLEALRDLTSPRALVIRDGERRRIPGREVVCGDLIVLSEGDRVPADAQLIEAVDLQVDESLLTGESVPVRKQTGAAPISDQIKADEQNLQLVFSGTLIVSGRGLAKVCATGARSEIGKIGAALQTIDSTPPRLQQETRKLVRIFAFFGIFSSVLAIVLFGLRRGGWLDALLAGIALGMSMLPEELPLVLTVFTVMGAWRISQARVLTRRAAAIETLGAATVLCTDKTGTLTENRMTLVELRTDDEIVRPDQQDTSPWPAPIEHLLDIGVLACAPEPFDPMEQAFHRLWMGRVKSSNADVQYTLARTWGLTPELLVMTQAWLVPGANVALIAAKGAPEAIATLCRLDFQTRAKLLQQADQMAAAGMRVLAVAQASHAGQDWPTSPQSFEFSLLGLVGLADPLRASVQAAVQECRSAGIRVVMITGDYPLTALAIARQAGLDATHVLSGSEIVAMSEDELTARVQSVSVFARITPGQKLSIVRALKARGEIVAMTGDGVNDAPALKAADIGIAMGGRGTDVAREAAAIVLLDDDFNSIVKTIRLGRRIYDNLRKAMGYILAIHIPIAGLALLPLITGMPIIFSPIHIAFLEMIIDPVCSVVFEAEKEEADIMRRPPRHAESRLFSRPLLIWSVVQGVFAFAVVAILYWSTFELGMSDAEVRAFTFVALVLANLGLVLVNRSFSSTLSAALRGNNRALWWVSGVAMGLLGLTLVFASTRKLFSFAPLHGDDLMGIFIAVAALIITLELLKHYWRRYLMV